VIIFASVKLFKPTPANNSEVQNTLRFRDAVKAWIQRGREGGRQSEAGQRRVDMCAARRVCEHVHCVKCKQGTPTSRPFVGLAALREVAAANLSLHMQRTYSARRASCGSNSTTTLYLGCRLAEHTTDKSVHPCIAGGEGYVALHARISYATSD
jgi:hypothetical protein